MTNRYTNRWGHIRQVKVPNAVIQDGLLALDSCSIGVLLILLQINNRPVKAHDSLATVKVGHEKLMERTGYSTNVITKAIKGLQNRKFIEVARHHKKYGEFGANEYILCHPEAGMPLTAKRDVVYGNGLPYFTFPECVVKEHTANWSLSNMSASELRLYVCILYLANRHRSNEFTATSAELRKLSGLAPATFRKALDELECRGLAWVTASSKPYRISLCDPYTGQPLHEQTGVDEDDPANYFTIGEKGQSKRLNLNSGDREQVEKLIRSCLSEEPVMQGNGDLRIRCPFHSDDNPSCSVSSKKNGCWHCFGCGKNGSLIQLLMQLKGITKGEAIQQTATAMGIKIEFHEPDTKALAIHSYRNEKGRLLKQVLRYSDENGQKVFRQRKPGKGGWVWSTAGLPLMLFNMELLSCAGVVCITEGEKDAQTVTDLHLLGGSGLVIGMTSGGAGSWDASLAKLLRGKRVVLMPDADAPGARFAADVEASLKSEGIEYRVVTFADAGHKDITEFLEAGHTVKELAERIGTDWVEAPTQSAVQEHESSEEAYEIAF
jgi:DNA-binding MarR family transcriptional regulator